MLVVVTSDDGYALLLRRVRPFEFWQSVTGSLEPGESHAEAAMRELYEETGLTDEGVLQFTGVSRQFVIDPRWRHKFARGAAENVEFEYRYRMPERVDIGVHSAEHSGFRWLLAGEAAESVWSWTNRDALRSVTR